MREAHRKINDAERSEAVKLAESEKKVKDVAKILWDIFAKMDFTPEDDHEMIDTFQSLARKLLSKTRLKANDLIHEIGSTAVLGDFISRKRSAFNKFMQGQDPDLLDLKRKLKVIPNVTKGFIKLRRDFYGFHTMEARQIWIDNQYGAEQNHRDLAEYAEEAMAMVDQLFNSGISSTEAKFALHPRVAAENDIDALQELAITEPVDEESFHIMQSAATKISLIHYTLYAKQVDQDVIKPASKALHQRLEDIIDTKNYLPDQVLNPPELPEDGVVPKLGADDKYVIIDRFEVDLEAKTNVSIIRKLIIKDIQNLGKIDDLIRGRIFLPAFRSYSIDGNGKKVWNKKQLKEDIAKVLGILFSVFGNDVAPDRTRWTVDTGGSNPFSTGEHRGLHVTLNFKHHTPPNGVNGGLAYKLGINGFEFQILGHMTPEEELLDHAQYRDQKTKEIREVMGVDLRFEDFIMQLVEVVNSDHDFDDHYTPGSDAHQIGNKPFNKGSHREKMFLLTILLNPKNANSINKLMENPDQRAELEKAISKLESEERTGGEPLYEIIRNPPDRTLAIASFEKKLKEILEENGVLTTEIEEKLKDDLSFDEVKKIVKLIPGHTLAITNFRRQIREILVKADFLTPEIEAKLQDDLSLDEIGNLIELKPVSAYKQAISSLKRNLKVMGFLTPEIEAELNKDLSLEEISDLIKRTHDSRVVTSLKTVIKNMFIEEEILTPEIEAKLNKDLSFKEMSDLMAEVPDRILAAAKFETKLNNEPSYATLRDLIKLTPVDLTKERYRLICMAQQIYEIQLTANADLGVAIQKRAARARKKIFGERAKH